VVTDNLSYAFASFIIYVLIAVTACHFLRILLNAETYISTIYPVFWPHRTLFEPILTGFV